MADEAGSNYYPVFLALVGRPCLVVGGGAVAAGKVSGLLAAGACVTVVSPDLEPSLQSLAGERRIAHRSRRYQPEDVEGMALVIVATNDRRVNAQVAADCRSRGIWVNAADDPPNCDFILPSVIRRGKVTLAASTSGASPALARRLREDLTAFLSDDTSALADLMGEVRQELRARGISVEAQRWQEAIDARLRALLAQRRLDEARDYLLRRLGVEAAHA
jgi:precorrin-2 dehydrogenase/sirohydrochlorin ferrochelatase